MKTSLSTVLRHVALAAALACTVWSTQAAVPQATVTPTPTPGFGARAAFFGEAGFVEQEVILSGQARKFKGSGSLASDGRWAATAVPGTTPYTTMAIVRRPADPARFNGIVIVEWLNVSTGYPLDVDWGMAHEAILREGYAYVGVNVQKMGIQGVQKLRQFGDRYASGSIPDDDLSYDIFSQAAQALREQTALLLGDLRPRKIIAAGHSQSAMRLTTYANAIQPLANVYDGILIHGRGGVGIGIGQGSSVPSGSVVRADTRVPVFVLQSEMDVAFGPSTSKQPDSAKVRHWEVAGTSHADQYLLDNIGEVSGRDVGWTPPGCGSPYNAMPFYMAENAAIEHLKNWVTAGTPPPVAPRMARDWLGFIKKDAHGNAVGGVRLPDIEVPVAKYSHANFTTGSLAFLDLFACVAGGSTTYFKADKLKSLYPTRADYVNKYRAAADAAVAKGYVRPADRDAAVRRAQAAAVPQ